MGKTYWVVGELRVVRLLHSKHVFTDAVVSAAVSLVEEEDAVLVFDLLSFRSLTKPAPLRFFTSFFFSLSFFLPSVCDVYREWAVEYEIRTCSRTQ